MVMPRFPIPFCAGVLEESPSLTLITPGVSAPVTTHFSINDNEKTVVFRGKFGPAERRISQPDRRAGSGQWKLFVTSDES